MCTDYILFQMMFSNVVRDVPFQNFVPKYEANYQCVLLTHNNTVHEYKSRWVKSQYLEAQGI